MREKSGVIGRRELGYYFLRLVLCFSIICTYRSGAGVGSLCSRIFFDKKVSVFAGLECNDSRGTVLIEAHRTAEQLQMFARKKEIQEFEKGLREVAGFLERSPTPKEQAVLDRLDVSLKTSMNKIPEIMEFITEASPTEARYFGQIAQATLAVFSKHIPTILREDVNQTDWPRINHILRNVAAFNKQRPEFSLYKIKRAIEGRYSLKEFILCRV